MSKPQTIAIISNKYTALFNELVESPIASLQSNGDITFEEFPHLCQPITKNRYINIILVDITYFASSSDALKSLQYMRANHVSARIIAYLPYVKDASLLKNIVDYGIYDLVGADYDPSISEDEFHERSLFDIEQVILNPTQYGDIYLKYQSQ